MYRGSDISSSIAIRVAGVVEGVAAHVSATRIRGTRIRSWTRGICNKLNYSDMLYVEYVQEFRASSIEHRASVECRVRVVLVLPIVHVTILITQSPMHLEPQESNPASPNPDSATTR